MTPLERLYGEEIPTGTFGDAHPTHKTPQQPPRPWTPKEQDDHRRVLTEALNGWDWQDDYADARRTRDRQRHLRAIPPAA